MDEDTQKGIATIRKELDRIPQEVLNQLFESLQRHSYTVHLDAHHLVRSPLQSKSPCWETDLLFLSGRSTTNSSGKATLPIDSLICKAAYRGIRSVDAIVMVREPQLVATPVSSAPVLITSQDRSSPRVSPAQGYILAGRSWGEGGTYLRDGVTVDVTTWKLDGTPAGQTIFSWMCVVEVARLVSVGG